MSRNLWKTAFVCLFLALPALAGDIELTPTIGYRTGGDFEHLAVEGVPVDFSFEDAEEYGLIITFPITHRVDFEFRWTHQGTDIDPSNPNVVAPNDLSADTYLGGIVWAFDVDSKVVRPFLNFEIGATQFDLGDGFTGDAGFAVAVGGGSKFYLGEHFGLRVQGSYLSSNLPGGQDLFCNSDVCYTATSRNSVGQFELTGGVVFKF